MMSLLPTASAFVSLPSDLHPDYAPAINLQGATPGSKADPNDYANFFLQLIAGGLLYMAGPVAILVIAVAGLRYVTAHGKQENIEGAKKTLEWAIIGLILIILSFAIVRIVITTLIQTPTANQSITDPNGIPNTRD